MKLNQNSDYVAESLEEIHDLRGQVYIEALINRLVLLTKAESAWVSQIDNSRREFKIHAMYADGKFGRPFTYTSNGSPCGLVVEKRGTVEVRNNLRDLFKNADQRLLKMMFQGYLGLPVHSTDGDVIGVIALNFASQDMDLGYLAKPFEMVQKKVAEEIREYQSSELVREKEEQLKGLIDSIQDLLINFRADGTVIMLNNAARNHLRLSGGLEKNNVKSFLTDSGMEEMWGMIEEINSGQAEESGVACPEGFGVISSEDELLEVEGALNRYQLNKKWYYTLVLRDLKHKLKAEEQLKSLLDTNRTLQNELEEAKLSSQLIGDSQQIKLLWQDIYMVAHTDATVLIYGETGTGKELVAKQVHQIGARKDKPLVSVNCGAINPNLVESELFGHIKGSFTGAVTDRKGRFEMAEGGTIFLDEIGELSPEMQIKLLRVIQEREFEAVGSEKTIKVDVRIVAATHRNLNQLTKSGDFRKDLYYRLNVFPIEVPALRDRGDDILTLTKSFIDKFKVKLGKKVEELSEGQQQLLKSYNWPGNVRELQNVVERAVIISQNGKLDFTALGVADDTGFDAGSKRASDFDDNRILTKSELLEVEKQNIIKALKITNGKVSGKGGAAELLGLAPSTLSSRIITLKIKKVIYEFS